MIVILTLSYNIRYLHVAEPFHPLTKMQRNAAVETSFASAGTDLDKHNDDDVSDISEDEDFLHGIKQIHNYI
jgi:hypothetical protein